MDKKYILVINAGSSTLKFKVFTLPDLKTVKQGIVERIGLINSFIILNGEKEINEVESHEEAFKLVIAKLGDIKNDIKLVGHRVVHGGEDFYKPTIITKKVMKKLRKYNKLAPLHNPVNLSCIKASDRYIKDPPDIAVFDTSFYQTLPQHAYIYAIPLKYYQRHKIRRYGFHGISHQYVAQEVAKKMKKPLRQLNLITCHLGSGCSITAIKKGQAIDTSMGFTPLEGLVMSTRCGNIDPAIPMYLMRKVKLNEEDVNNLLNKRSGLFGLSGSMDMRELLTKAGYSVPGFKMSGRIRKREKEIAQLTLEIFIYNIKKYIGAYSMILGKVDALAFTGGIGERSKHIQRMVLKDLPKFKTFVIPANEELMIAREAEKLIR
ncbi:acetate/propionate family kinase [Patescibacteria group bacterium]